MKPARAVIVGGGYIGLEMAEALAAHNLAVTVVELAEQLMPTIDPEMAEHIQVELKRQGVAVQLGQAVEGFQGEERVQRVVVGGQELPAELVIFSVGVKSNNRLAKAAGIALGPTGAVAVDARQQTNLPGIWAAGDVAEARHRVTGKAAHIPLGTTASKQGRVAGTNIGGGQATFAGIVGTAAVKVFDLHIALTGLSEQQAKDEGFDAASTTIKSSAQADYMPGKKPIHVKLVYEKGSQRLLGGQIVGVAGVAKRIDVIAAALQAGWTTYDLAELDMSYAPPFAPVWAPILLAANVANG
jgi:NADPH-dependent 2,4-dienoyl-CoA reductase/sulfur reductase-like enzyme